MTDLRTKPPPAKTAPSLGSGYFSAAEVRRDLRQKTIRGGAITMLAQAFKFILQMGSTIVLARLLSPEDFGVIAMVTVIIGFLMALSDMGLSLAVVQREDLSQAQVNQLFWITLVVHAGFAVLFCGAAPVLAAIYNEPRVIPITLVMTSALLIQGLSIQHQAILRRRMRFGALAAIEVTAMSCGVASGITMAAYGAGYWALVGFYLTQRLVESIGLWIACRWRPGRPRRGVPVRSLLRFGGYHTGFQLVNYFARNSDNMLIGWFWGAYPLGLYSRAYSILMLPLVQINVPVTAVALPAMSRLQGEAPRFRRAYLQYLSMLLSITLPGVAFTIVMAPEIVALCLGPQWSQVTNVFRILGFVGLVQVTTNTAGTLLVSIGRTDRMFVFGVCNTIGTVAAFVIGLDRGIEAVALAYAVYTWVAAVPIMWYASRPTSVSVPDILGALVRPAIVAGLVAATLLAAGAALGQAAPWQRFAAGLVVFAAVWFACYGTVFRAGNPLRLLRQLR